MSGKNVMVWCGVVWHGVAQLGEEVGKVVGYYRMQGVWGGVGSGGVG